MLVNNGHETVTVPGRYACQVAKSWDVTDSAKTNNAKNQPAGWPHHKIGGSMHVLFYIKLYLLTVPIFFFD